MIREVVNVNSSPFLRCVQYVIDDNVVGKMMYSLIYDRMELEDIFVDVGYRNRGIGNKFMSYLVSEAISNRVVNITLEVRVSNDIARNMYKKYGFREVAMRKNYYGNEDAILMEKQVM